MKIYDLFVDRDVKTEEETLGILYIDNKKFSYTLEDRIQPKGIKIYGQTCLPSGNYKVKVTYSPTFKRRLPLIYNQSDLSIFADGIRFTGVRFHGGNTHINTLACILVAKNRYLNKPQSFYDKAKNTYYKVKNWIQGSKSDELTKLLDNGQEHNLRIN